MELSKRLQGLMVKYRFRPDKKLGQHFCINKNLLEKIVDEAELEKKDEVVEIGPGTGFLTELMLKKCKVIGVEKDRVLAELLEKEFNNRKNFELVKGDYLKQEVRGNKIVALPPYNISDDIMEKIFEKKPELCALVFQKEFVEKVAASPGFTDYSHISVIASVLFEIKVPVKSISPDSFYPKPEAYSALLVLKQKKKANVDMKKFSVFLKQIFRFKNKNLRNALQYSKIDCNITKGGVENLNEKVNLISPEKYVEIFKKIFQE